MKHLSFTRALFISDRCTGRAHQEVSHSFEGLFTRAANGYDCASRLDWVPSASVGKAVD